MLGELLGSPLEELIGRSLLEFAADDLDRYVEMLDLSTGFSGALMGPLTVRYRHADGSIRRSALWARNHLDDADVAAIVCTFVPEESETAIAAALGSVAEGEPVDATLGLLASAALAQPGSWWRNAAVREPIRLDLAEIQVGASVGVARTDEPVGVGDLLDRSDAALLAAKAAGKGRWHLADAG